MLRLINNNPLVTGLNILGGYLLQTGVSKINFMDLFNKDNSDLGIELPASRNTGEIVAYGGTVSGKIEVEGGEAFDTLDGRSGVFKGPKHEQGGIDILADGLMNIFSNRIKYRGKTLAERKIEREAELEKIKKKLEKNPDDKVLLETYNRMKEAAKIVDKKDLALQEKFKNQLFKDSLAPDLSNPQPINEDGEVEFKYGATLGDLVGLFGQFYGSFSPMHNTITAREKDSLNINPYEDYGKDTLEKLDQTKDYLNDIESTYNKKLLDSKTQLQTNNRNSARGVNTLRAMDIAAQSKTNKALEDLANTTMGNISNINTKEATTMLDIDKVVMRGEEMRDLNDRRDADNFVTQLGRDKSTLAEGLQHIGKSLNQITSRNSNSKLLSQMSKIYDYNPITQEFTPKKDIDWASISLEDLYAAYSNDNSFAKFTGKSKDEFEKLSPSEQLKLFKAYINKYYSK